MGTKVLVSAVASLMVLSACETATSRTEITGDRGEDLVVMSEYSQLPPQVERRRQTFLARSVPDASGSNVKSALEMETGQDLMFSVDSWFACGDVVTERGVAYVYAYIEAPNMGDGGRDYAMVALWPQGTECSWFEGDIGDPIRKFEYEF